MILSVYGRVFRLYILAAITPIPLSSFAGQPGSNIGRSFLKRYAGGLGGSGHHPRLCDFSAMASAPPAVDHTVSAVAAVWNYVGELIFNLLVLAGAIKARDRTVEEMMGL